MIAAPHLASDSSNQKSEHGLDLEEVQGHKENIKENMREATVEWTRDPLIYSMSSSFYNRGDKKQKKREANDGY